MQVHDAHSEKCANFQPTRQHNNCNQNKRNRHQLGHGEGLEKNLVLPGLERLPACNAYGMEARPLLAHHVVSRRHGTVPSSTDWAYFSFSSWFASLQSRIGTRPAPQK